MKYAEIQNEQVVAIHQGVPTAWNNISGFNSISPEGLLDLTPYGYPNYKFYPAIEMPFTANKRLYIVGPPVYTIDDDVHAVYITYPPVPISLMQAWQAIREDRNNMLFQTDWTQLEDSPLSNEQKDSYKVYRQSLRDITNQEDPFNIIWPNPPN